jgi:hypothetical protein
MKNLVLFEEYPSNSSSGGNMFFTERDIERLLEDFNGAEFFEFDLEKSKIDTRYPAQLTTYDYKNGIHGELTMYLDEAYYKVSPKFIEAIKSNLNAVDVDDDDLMSLTKDLGEVGFEEKPKVQWTDIKRAIEHMIDREYFSYLSIDVTEIDIKSEIEQSGMEFEFRIYMTKYTGDVSFDTQEFLDYLLTELFYNKDSKK